MPDHQNNRTITSLRKQTGLTQKEFASKFKIPKRTLQNWEAYDRDPSGPMARKAPVYVTYLLSLIIDSETKGKKVNR